MPQGGMTCWLELCAAMDRKDRKDKKSWTKGSSSVKDEVGPPAAQTANHQLT